MKTHTWTHQLLGNDRDLLENFSPVAEAVCKRPSTHQLDGQSIQCDQTRKGARRGEICGGGGGRATR